VTYYLTRLDQQARKKKKKKVPATIAVRYAEELKCREIALFRELRSEEEGYQELIIILCFIFKMIVPVPETRRAGTSSAKWADKPFASGGA
jgi:hypothetical protein